MLTEKKEKEDRDPWVKAHSMEASPFAPLCHILSKLGKVLPLTSCCNSLAALGPPCLRLRSEKF